MVLEGSVTVTPPVTVARNFNLKVTVTMIVTVCQNSSTAAVDARSKVPANLKTASDGLNSARNSKGGKLEQTWRL